MVERALRQNSVLDVRVSTGPALLVMDATQRAARLPFRLEAELQL